MYRERVHPAFHQRGRKDEGQKDVAGGDRHAHPQDKTRYGAQHQEQKNVPSGKVNNLRGKGMGHPCEGQRAHDGAYSA